MKTYHKRNALLPYALPEELDFINVAFSGDQPIKSVLMLGCGPGVFLIAMFEGNSLPDDIYVIDNDPHTFGYARAHLREAGINTETFNFIECDVTDHTKLKRPFDFIMFDVNVDYYLVRNTWLSWKDHISPGGFAFFHDYLSRPNGFLGNEEWKEEGPVCEVIYDFVQDDPEFEFVDTTGISILFRKIL